MLTYSKTWKTYIALGLVAAFCTALPVLQPRKAEAASLGQQILLAGVAVALVNSYFNQMNDHGQKSILADTKKQTGVSDDPKYQERLNALYHRLKNSGLIKADYAIYANPKKEFNAFCTLGHVISVNKGALDTLDDDELAAVLAHEMRHGEGKHPVQGVTKSVQLGLAVDIYLSSNPNTTSYILSGLAGNYINNEMFTMSQEWEADNYAFTYATAAGFNPGGPAASMVKLRSLLGDLWHEGLARTVNPNNHPKTTDRVNNYAQKMTAYSEGHVKVKNDKTVQIDGVSIITPVKAYEHSGEERAYLIAGHLAQAYHNHALAPATVGEDGCVYVGAQAIVTPAEQDASAEDIVTALNTVLQK